MKTLYISDLDGTLLGSNQAVSEYTSDIINKLNKQGFLFSYATARSIITAKKVTKGIEAKIPLILYNGAFIMDNVTEEILVGNYFDQNGREILEDLFANEIYPIVYAMVNKTEKLTFIPELCTAGMDRFLDSRPGDIRINPVHTLRDLCGGDVFYITCIDAPAKLEPIYDKYKNKYHCVYHRDIYTGDQWLEIMPLQTSKANAINQLKELLGCDRIVSFGDGKNDIDMFKMSDECYAVQNADEELKEIATAVIGSNNDDAVAKWLEQNLDLGCL